jgi:hypothetical protein
MRCEADIEAVASALAVAMVDITRVFHVPPPSGEAGVDCCAAFQLGFLGRGWLLLLRETWRRWRWKVWRGLQHREVRGLCRGGSFAAVGAKDGNRVSHVTAQAAQGRALVPDR